MIPLVGLSLHTVKKIGISDSSLSFFNPFIREKKSFITLKNFPELSNNSYIIADRFKDSTLAYQSGGRGLNIDFLIKLNNFATHDVNPDLTFFIDIDPVDADKRINKKSLDRIESSGIKFQTKVRKSYLKIAKLFPHRIHIINGNDTIQNIHKSIWDILINYADETS